VKISSGWGFPRQRISKKIIDRVRPGVGLVLAVLAPSRELITLDLPTFDRPRKATSGSVGAGNCPASLADFMKRAKTRINQFAVLLRKLQAEHTEKESWRREDFPEIAIGIFIPVPAGACSRCLPP